MRQQLSSALEVVAHEPVPRPLAEGDCPYLGRQLPGAFSSVDIANVDGALIAIRRGPQCVNTKGGVNAQALSGPAYIDDSYDVLRCRDAREARYLARVLAHTDAGPLVTDRFSSSMRIDLDRLLNASFNDIGADAAQGLENAFERCEDERRAAGRMRRNALSMADRLYARVLSTLAGRRTPVRTLGEVALVMPGKDLALQKRRPGKIPVWSAYGRTGTHDEALARHASVVAGLRRARSFVLYSSEPCWPTGDTVFVDEGASEIPLPLIFFAIRAKLGATTGGSTHGTADLIEAVRLAPVAEGEAVLESACRLAVRIDELCRNEEALVDELVAGHLEPVAAGRASWSDVSGALKEVEIARRTH